jgi:hypothetical protein
MTLLCVVALSVLMAAQTAVPRGTIIPVRLNTALDAKTSKPGETVTASVAQDVPLYNGAKIKAGSKVLGEVLAVTPAANSQPAMIALRFDKIEISGKTMPIETNLRALASALDVEDAQTSISGDDRGSNPPWSQTVTQIGGDVVYREDETVVRGDKVVGKPVFAGDWGVLSLVSPSLDDRCRGAVAGNENPQALWVFSHDACGVYGYDAVIKHAGRSNPRGEIVLASTDGGLNVRRYSAMLLRVNSAPETMSRNDSAER